MTCDRNLSRGGFLKFVAYLQVIGIILVVLGHSFHEYENHGYTLTIYRMIYSFHMPLFMFVSGFLMGYTYRTYGAQTWSSFFLSKLRRLLLPYLILLTVTFFPRCVFNDMADDSIEMSLKSFFNSILYRDKLVIPYFWFLPSVFTLLIVNYGALRIVDKFNFNEDKTLVWMVVLFIIMPFFVVGCTSLLSLDKTLQYGLFFYLGMLYSKYYERIDRVVSIGTCPILFLSTCVWVILFFLVSDTIFCSVCSLCGIIMCVSLAKYIECHDITVLDHLIGCNYMIFLLSWYFNIVSQQVLHHYVEAPWWFFTSISFITGIYIPVVIYRYLQQNSEGKLAYIGSTLLGHSFKRVKKVNVPSVE